MLYLGQFDFRIGGLDESDTAPDRGYFTCVAEADGIEAALDRFRALILRLREEDDVFNEVPEVYLDACIEIRSIPPSGFLAHFVAYTEGGEGAVSTSVRGASEEDADAYSVGPVEEQEGTVEPFVRFE